jgi:hypothetical protein
LRELWLRAFTDGWAGERQGEQESGKEEEGHYVRDMGEVGESHLVTSGSVEERRGRMQKEDELGALR